MILVHVRERKCKDGSITYQGCWTDPKDSRERRVALGVHTSAKPPVRERREAKKRADSLAQQMQLELNAQYESGRTVQVPIQHAAEWYVAWLLSPGPGGQAWAAEGTVKNVERHLRDFVGFMEAQGCKPKRFWLKRVSEKHVSDWRDSLYARGLESSTVNVMLSAISGWMRWGREKCYTRRDPLEHVRRPRATNGRATTPLAMPETMRETLREFLEGLKTPRQECAIILACTGLRQGEFRALQADHLDLSAATLQVQRGRETTKLHERTLPLCPQATEAVTTLLYRTDGPYLIGPSRGEKPLTSQLHRWMQPYKPHSLRKFFQTALETLGAPSNVVEDLLAHSPGKVRAAYTPQENLPLAREWIQRLGDWLDGTA